MAKKPVPPPPVDEVVAAPAPDAVGSPAPAPAFEAVTEKAPRFRRRKDARPDELIRAAVALFGEQGFAATNLKDVAKRAGVSKGTVYLYFKSKEDLLRAAVRTSVVPIVDAADELEVDAEGSASELLRTLMVRWVQEFEERGVAGIPKLVMAEAGNFPELAEDYINSVIQRVRRLVARVLKRGVRDGEFRDVDVRSATHLLLAPVLYAQVHAAAFASIDAGSPPVAVLVGDHLDHFLRSIAASEASP
jgi:AcrR family transcriptional regulator